jgi:hypothetical protein
LADGLLTAGMLADVFNGQVDLDEALGVKWHD